MAIWITATVPDGSNRIIKAERHIWQININQKYFQNVVLELVDRFTDFFCKVCLQNHNSESGLIKCLRLHRRDTVNFYLDYMVSDVL
jgi:hypothetical protein